MNWSVAPVSQVLLVPLVQWFVHAHGYRTLLLALALVALPALAVAWRMRGWRPAFGPRAAVLRPGNQRLARGEALHLGGVSGQLTVLQGRLWLTRHHECTDHFVAAGERIVIKAGEGVVIEPVGAGNGVRVHWWPEGRERRSENGRWLSWLRRKVLPWNASTTPRACC